MSTTRLRPTLLATALALAPCAGVAAPATAQHGGGAGSVAGQVVDARTAEPVVGATVVLQPEVVGAFPGASGGSGFAAAARTTTTDGAGRYRFGGLSPGAYRLSAGGYGYRSYSVVVEVAGGDAAVSVGLVADPIALEPVRVTERSRGPFVAADPFGPDPGLARRMVADLRRRHYLTTDVRELTMADVVEGVTLGEPDLFRALQRLPGVSTRSDYTAALWTRGASWSQTRVYFDGIPVFNPLHALGMISGIGSTGLGTVWFHPGARSAGIAEGAAGVIDLRSRAAEGAGELNLQADASLATAGITLDQRVLDGRAGWMLSGRRSYMDWLADLARHAAGEEDDAFPYRFVETSGRVDARVAEGHTVEASWLWEGDDLASSADPAVDPLRAAWGNALGRVTASSAMGRWRTQHTLGASRHHGLVRSGEAVRFSSGDEDRRSETAVGVRLLRGALWPAPTSPDGPAWTLGYEFVRHDVDYTGPIPLPVPRSEASTLDQATPGDSLATVSLVEWRSDLGVLALWGERTWGGERLTVRGGLRAEASAEVRNAAPVRFAPRLAVRFAPLPEVVLSAGLTRVYQYSQAIAPGGVQLASLVSTDAWLLAGQGVPPLRSDLATAGIETWLAPGRVVTLNTFGRRTTGVVVPNPVPGPILGRSPSLVLGENRAAGVEASVRQLDGPVTGSVSYSLTRSRMYAWTLEFPAAADRTHVLSATGMVHPGGSFRVGAAFTAATGVPYTRAVSDPDECATVAGCDPEALPWAGPPNAARAPTHASLDLLFDWSTELGGLQLGAYAQIRNVLGRENATVYTGSDCMIVGCSTEELRNAYEQGVPRLPILGVRVRR